MAFGEVLGFASVMVASESESRSCCLPVFLWAGRSTPVLSGVSGTTAAAAAEQGDSLQRARPQLSGPIRGRGRRTRTHTNKDEQRRSLWCLPISILTRISENPDLGS